MAKRTLPFSPILIMVAASFWAIDALFRTQLTFKIPSASIVFFEHLIGFVILSPIFFANLDKVKSLKLVDWFNLIALTIFSSVGATLLFTEALNRSFATFDFVTPLLLQKLQPIFVITLSAIFLKEKITPRFLGLAFIALIGSYMIGFGTEAIKFSLQGKELVVVLALAATFSWGIGTIFSKKVLKKLNFPVATSLRFLLAIPTAYIASVIFHQTYNFALLTSYQIWRFIVIASITGGVFSLLLYYKGLQKTEARISTIAELMFPIVSILIAITWLNPYGKPQILSIAQIFGIIILMISMLLISFDQKHHDE